MVLCGFWAENRPYQPSEPQGNTRYVARRGNVLVWCEGFPDWKIVGDVEELRGLTPPPVPKTHLAAPMPTWRVRWWWYPVALFLDRLETDTAAKQWLGCRTSNGSDEKTKTRQRELICAARVRRHISLRPALCTRYGARENRNLLANLKSSIDFKENYLSKNFAASAMQPRSRTSS